MEKTKIKVIPVREFFYNEESNYGIYACETEEKNKVKLNQYGNFSLKGSTVQLEVGREYNATVIEEYDNKRSETYYTISSIYEDMPTEPSKQRAFLEYVLTFQQVDAIYNTYPNHNIIELIQNNLFDYNKVKGIGEKTYTKLREKIVENIEFQKAFEFFSDFGVTNNLIIKLVKYFKSAGVLIERIQKNPYAIMEVNGVGFKKADEIALSMGYEKQGEFRICSAVEHILEEASSNGHTYALIDKTIDEVYELINISTELISEQVKDTQSVKVIGDKLVLLKNYEAEKYVAKRIKEILVNSNALDINVDEFILKLEKENNVTFTHQQKEIFSNVAKYNCNLLVGNAGVGKSYVTSSVIQMLEELNINYTLLSPSAKAAKVISNYTGRSASTIHRAIGLGLNPQERAAHNIPSEVIIVDEVSMLDIQLCASLLKKCIHEQVRVLFIGDDFQIPSIGAGNVLYDLIHSGIVPLTKLDIVFRQKEGGMLDVATKLRKGEKFIDNGFWGIKELGKDCIIAAVPQEKIEAGYKYYLKDLLQTYSHEDITIVTPTNKGSLGTFSINDEVRTIVNPSEKSKKEITYGMNKTIFREGDLVLNTVNTYKIENTDFEEVSIVNGDIAKIIEINTTTEEVLMDFEFTKILVPYKMLKQFINAWCMTKHKMQGSANKAIIAIVDRSMKYQLNFNNLV